MKKVRNFEMRSIDMYKKGEMPGFLHPCVGQEATVSGNINALEKSDLIITNHRGHGHLIAKGVNLDKMMAELFAKETGCCKGRGGSMHIMSKEDGILGANGIVGAGISIAPGAALAAKLNGTGQVVMCFFGDGASNIGSFHEGINLASIWKLPVIFVCENNMYAESTLQTYATNIKHISERCASYGIPGITVDGNNVEEVYNASKEAIDRARAGEGPTLIECCTYKWFGHYIGDPALYRSEEEVEEWKKKDPIPLYESQLLNENVLTTEIIEKIDKELFDELEHAVTFAKSSPDPDPETACNYIYA
ncbi:MAG: thiamine pyrophosphate-dependent dehydrogenase E1 component subunit alpha [Sedimentibacter sp.]